MSMELLDKSGLAYFWTKLKAYFAPKVHTHNAFETKHSYTVAANAAKNWYRIANANTSQTDTIKHIHAQFILTAYNASYDTGYYERWFVNAEVFGRNAHIVILGNAGAPFSQARILYENTVADLDANDRPAIDIYLNYQLANGTTKIEIEEVYNSGWTFVADGQLAASTVPSGFENVACSVRNNGVDRSTYADYVSYLNRQISNFTAAFTLADSYLYRSRTLNCTGTFTITVPSINSGYMWCVIKNKNTSSGVITLHPSTTSVLIDGSNADITLQPMEYVCIHSAGANNYSLIADGRWKSQKANDDAVVHLAGTETITGEKTFTATNFIYNTNPVFDFSWSDLTKGTNPSSSKWANISFIDKNKNNRTNYRAACFEGGISASGETQLYLRAYDWTAGSTTSASIMIAYPKGGTPYTAAPTPAVADNSTKIATTAWCRTATGNFACNAATASSAAKLTTARKINGVSFDGSADVTLTAVVSSASRSADIAANGTFTVPSYIVGAQALLVYLDGCLSRQGDGWDEVGTAGTASTTIKFNQLIPADMEIVVRVN